MTLKPKEEAVLSLIVEDTSYENYFFKRVSDIKWFEPLKSRAYFSPQKAPLSKPTDQEGFYMIPEWNVLPYLERVSQQVSAPGNEKYIDVLLAIIKEVSNHRDANGQHIDNYRTWYYFTKILVNMPSEKIPEEIIDLIPIWLDSKFSTSLLGAEIVSKLLPKLLNSERSVDWQKAERLIEIITTVKWVSIPENQRSLRERDIEARTIIEPHWLKKGFEKNFEKIGTVCSIRVIESLAKKLLRIFSKHYSHGYDVDYEGKKYQITHSLLKDGKHQISLYLLKYPEDWDGLSRSKIEKKSVTNFIISDFGNRADFLTKVKGGLIKNAFPSLNTELDKQISSIYTLHDYTYIGYNSLYVSPEHINIDDTDRILVYILKEILSVKAKLDIENTSKVLEKLLSKEYPYPFFKRLVLFIVGREWDKYKEYFFEILELEEMKCFEDPDFAMELSILLRNNFSKFDLGEKETIGEIIEKGPEDFPEEDRDKYVAYWKQKWLSTIKDDPIFAPRFEEQKKVTGIDKEKFSFGTQFKTSWGVGLSPLSVEGILEFPNPDLAMKLKEFRSEKKWEGMTVAALSESLKESVMKNPDKFTEQLTAFKDVGFIYIYKILDGLKDSWKAKKSIEWAKIFDFLIPYIKKNEFWKDEYIVEAGTWLGGADHEWITGIIAELIEEGTGDDAWAFSEDYFEKAKEIVFTLIKKPEEKEEITDYVFHTLNTPCGKLITALVYLALRIARVNEKKGIKNDPRWAEDFKTKFDELLKQKVVDSYTSLGRFLPQLAYLDKSWIIENIKGLASACNSKQWTAFFEGYLSIRRVYDDIYELMKPHYEHALYCDFKEKSNQERLMEHMCIGYLRDHEKLADPESLFQKIMDAWKPERIKEVIGFFWMQRNYLMAGSEENEKMRRKIIAFWAYLYEKYKGKDVADLTKEDKQILSSVSKLTVFLSQINAESYDWLMLSAPYVHEDYNSSFFIEYLDELKDRGEKNETARYISKIYLKMIEKITPDFDQKHIRSIIEFLYDTDSKEDASSICNIYGARDQEFLRDIYEKHAKRT